MIEGFLFCLGVVFCLWCLANLDVILMLILWAVVGCIILAAACAVIVAGWGIWREFDAAWGDQLSGTFLVESVAGILFFFGVCWVWAKWQDREQA